ncbi:MAG TPA: tripartite tricarboxylate transporter substrate binding protein [Burkholderiales bacterium]|nr:tripartite tricarboxylate transporter substrate binding protein [Burkholderiales bacterium]
MRTLVCALSALVFAVTAIDARAQDPAAGFPARTIRIVVPFPPGGVTDRLARMVAQKMQEHWGQPAVVENRPGASGMIAAETVAKSAPDGYTLMMGHIGTHAINVSLFGKLPYDPVKDFAPVSLLVSVPNVLLVHPSVPANSVQELVALAKARPGTLNFASPGSGTSGHMSAELFKSLAGIDIVHVPYKGPGPALQDLVAGQVNMLFDTVASSMPQVRGGKLKGLAVTTRERSAIAPGVPTMAESGVSGYEIAPWFAAYAPAGTPPAVVNKLQAEMARILGLPEVRTAFVDQQGMTLIASSPAELGAHTQREIAKWAQVVKATGAKAE